MTDSNDTLAREVDEELRREQLARLWQRYGTYVIGAVLALVIGVGGYKWNEQRQLSAAETAGAQFEAASNLAADGKADEAAKTFAAIGKEAPVGYAALAQLKVAGGHASAGRTAEALAAYELLAANPNADRLLRDFARLQAAALRLGDADFTEMQNRLNDLAADKAAWRFAARELIGLAALRAGKTAEARKSLEPLLTEPGVPAAMAERARVFMSRVVAAELAAGGAGAGSGNKPEGQK